MPEFPYRRRDRSVVPQVVATVRSDSTFVAGCLVMGRAHGYEMEIEYMQRADGTTRYRVWSDVQGIISTEERTLPLDVAAELARVRGAAVANTTLPDVTEGGRRAFIALADREGGVWVDAPTPRSRQVAEEGPLARIFAQVFPS